MKPSKRCPGSLQQSVAGKGSWRACPVCGLYMIPYMGGQTRNHRPLDPRVRQERDRLDAEDAQQEPTP